MPVQLIALDDTNADSSAPAACGCPACAGVSYDGPGDGPVGFQPATGGTAGNGLPILNWDEVAAQLTRNNASWSGSLGQAAVVTYAFRADPPSTMPSDTSGFSVFTAMQIQYTEAILALWADVANITFIRVGSGSEGAGAYSNDASMLFGNYSAGAEGASAFAYYPSPGATGPTFFHGDVWINYSLVDNATLSWGGFGAHTIAHEIGHAIGLAHPADYDSLSGEPVVYPGSSVYYQDSRAFTVMSYFGSGGVGHSLNSFAFGPQLHDIAAIQLLYGANMNTRTGDTVYGFNSNTGLIHYTITGSALSPVFSIWDAGGNDTIDFSGYATNTEIDLREEAFSSGGPGNGGVGVAIGNISIARGAVIENAIGGSGNDVIIGNGVANSLYGGAGNDSLDGGIGADTMDGGQGDDTYYIDNAGDYVWEAVGAGSDAVIVSINGYSLRSNFETLTLGASVLSGGGNTLNNTITGNALANTIWGGDGNDILDGATGADTMDGGQGDDTYYVDNAADYVWEASGAGTDTVIISIENYSLRNNFETLVLAANISNGGGNGLDNTITGNALANILWGAGGNDILNGGAGADTMDGGQGNDTYYIDSASDYVWEANGAGTDTVVISIENYSLRNNFETLVLAAGILNGGGNAQNNTITGNASNNLLWGAGGNDVLDGGLGADTMDGGQGDDTYYVDNAGDYVWEAVGAGTDTVIISIENYSLRNNFENLVLGSTIANGGGNALNNVVTGNALANTLWGAGGNDVLDGGAGADSMDGGQGDDTYHVDNAGDYVWEGVGAGTDTVISTIASYTLRNNFENLVLGSGATTGIGNALANRITGNISANTLTGDAGADTFVFAVSIGGGNIDAITDFNVADDTIELSTSIFTGIGLGALAANAFVIGAGAADADDRIIYNSATGALYYDADGNGGGAAIQIATLTAGLALTENDFLGGP